MNGNRGRSEHGLKKTSKTTSCGPLGTGGMGEPRERRRVVGAHGDDKGLGLRCSVRSQSLQEPEVYEKDDEFKQVDVPQCIGRVLSWIG